MEQFAENIWELEQRLKIPGVRVGHRMTVARLRNGDLWVHSPVKFDGAVAKDLDGLGTVQHLVAPSRYHDLHWPDWVTAYPNAITYCPPGFREEHPAWKFQRVLSPDVPEAWEDELPKLLIAGIPRLNEFVFLHSASRSLLLADLLFNFDVNKQNLFGKLFLKLNGIYGKPGCSRLFRHFIKDRAAFQNSITNVMRWDFDRIIVGHGANILSGGKAVLKRAMNWSENASGEAQ